MRDATVDAKFMQTDLTNRCVCRCVCGWVWPLLMYVWIYLGWSIFSVVLSCSAASRVLSVCGGQVLRLLLQTLHDGPVHGMLVPPPGPGQDVHPALLQLLGLRAEEQREVALGDFEGVPSLQAVTRLRK